MNVPKSTPYMGMLMETGTWTMEARVYYKKLMLYHNIKNSEDERIIKQILKVQEEEVRKSTWYADVKKAMEVYGITKSVTESSKSEWKKEVKGRIGEKTENEIRVRCKEMKKTRSTQEDPYMIKQYLKETTMTEATDILRTRLHMTRLTCNYGNSTKCPLCGHKGTIETEHYFTCQITRRLAGIWKTEPHDISGSTVEELRRAKNHIKKVEVMMEIYMPKRMGSNKEQTRNSKVD